MSEILTVLGECELCGNKRRRVHREAPNRFLDASRDQGFVWVCAPCGRMNTAINTGRAITCAAVRGEGKETTP